MFNIAYQPTRKQRNNYDKLAKAGVTPLDLNILLADDDARRALQKILFDMDIQKSARC